MRKKPKTRIVKSKRGTTIKVKISIHCDKQKRDLGKDSSKCKK